jgi:predicted transposase YdaD
MILGIRGIEESSVDQDIFAQGEAQGEDKGEAKGRVEEARLAILRLGRKKYGQPDEDVRSTIDAIDDVDRLNALLVRILDVSSWDELLPFPGTSV